MIFVSSHTYVHRLLKGGTLESAPIYVADGQTSFQESDFAMSDPAAMNLTGADLEQIRTYLEVLNNILRPDYRLPSSELPVSERTTAGQPV